MAEARRGEDPDHALRVGRMKDGEVDRGVEGSSVKEVLEVPGRAVPLQALHASAEWIGNGPAVEEGDRVAGRQQPPYKLIADEAGAADDQHSHPILASASRAATTRAWASAAEPARAVRCPIFRPGRGSALP